MKANELLDKALDFIVETQEQNDYICEQMCEEYVGDYCEKNCQNLNKECVKLFLQKYIIKHRVMKENGVPEKIYLQVCGDCPLTDCGNCKFEDFEDNVTWCKDKIFEKDIEYTRTDAFIEKACEWLRDNIYHRVYECGDMLGFPTAKFIEDFKNYMKGE